ncbi:MAG: M48 family metalloprotease [Candidatus Babeliales bacterium]
MNFKRFIYLHIFIYFFSISFWHFSSLFCTEISFQYLSEHINKAMYFEKMKSYTKNYLPVCFPIKPVLLDFHQAKEDSEKNKTVELALHEILNENLTASRPVSIKLVSDSCCHAFELHYEKELKMYNNIFSISYDPIYAKHFTKDEIKFALTHEIGHIDQLDETRDANSLKDIVNRLYEEIYCRGNYLEKAYVFSMYLKLLFFLHLWKAQITNILQSTELRSDLYSLIITKNCDAAISFFKKDKQEKQFQYLLDIVLKSSWLRDQKISENQVSSEMKKILNSLDSFIRQNKNTNKKIEQVQTELFEQYRNNFLQDKQNQHVIDEKKFNREFKQLKKYYFPTTFCDYVKQKIRNLFFPQIKTHPSFNKRIAAIEKYRQEGDIILTNAIKEINEVD